MRRILPYATLIIYIGPSTTSELNLSLYTSEVGTHSSNIDYATNLISIA